jgi:ProP effector
MSNASLKDQLQAVASQLSEPMGDKQKSKSQYQKKQSIKQPKPHWLNYAQYGVELLKAYFPHCFQPTSDIKPLKKGIKQDLVKQLSTMSAIVIEDKACMVKSIAYYVNTMAYHKVIVEGATRVDLDGLPSGVVTAEEAKHSSERCRTKLQSKRNPDPVTLSSSTRAKKEEVS